MSRRTVPANGVEHPPFRNGGEHHPFPPERLEHVAHRCGAIDEAGEPCQTFTLLERCLRHRRQPEPREERL